MGEILQHSSMMDVQDLGGRKGQDAGRHKARGVMEFLCPTMGSGIGNGWCFFSQEHLMFARTGSCFEIYLVSGNTCGCTEFGLRSVYTKT